MASLGFFSYVLKIPAALYQPRYPYYILHKHRCCWRPWCYL